MRFRVEMDGHEYRISMHVPCGTSIRTDQRDGETIEEMEQRHNDEEAAHVLACERRQSDGS